MPGKYAMASLTNGPVNLRSHLHDSLLERVVVTRPRVPVDAVGKGAVRAAQVPPVEVAVVAVAVPPAALKIVHMEFPQ